MLVKIQIAGPHQLSVWLRRSGRAWESTFLMSSQEMKLVVISSSRASFRPTVGTCVSCLAGKFCTVESPGKLTKPLAVVQIQKYVCTLASLHTLFWSVLNTPPPPPPPHFSVSCFRAQFRCHFPQDHPPLRKLSSSSRKISNKRRSGGRIRKWKIPNCDTAFVLCCTHISM